MKQIHAIRGTRKQIYVREIYRLRIMDEVFSCVAYLDVRDLGLQYDGTPPRRVFVRSVEASGWAYKNGVRAGDEIVSINCNDVSRSERYDFQFMFFSRPALAGSWATFLCSVGSTSIR